MKRSEILEAARCCVCGEREQDYGTPEDSFIDLAGYAACAGEIVTERSRPYE